MVDCLLVASSDMIQTEGVRQMTEQALKFEIKINFPIFFGLTFLAHLLLFAFFRGPAPTEISDHPTKSTRSPIKILSLGEKNSKSQNSVYIKPQITPSPQVAKKEEPKKLNLSDLMVAPQGIKSPSKTAQTPLRPGLLPRPTTALSGLRYGADEFKKMAKDPMLQGGADILSSQKVALNFEVPQGKKLDELNETELKLYGFLRRGAMKYVASLSAEIKEFEMQNPHLQFPLTDTKQVLTGRLIYDGQGNLKQIKMVRWTNIDKLQNFFESVLKRLDTLQNPPKELWIENGEFTVFVTLQLNG
jgi:hypothetical protein